MVDRLVVASTESSIAVSVTEAERRRLLRPPLVRRVFNSSSALIGNVFVQQAFRFGSNLVLTRLLFPEAFGVVLLVTSVMYVMALLAETGIHAFIIRTENALQPDVIDTLWSVQVLRGVLLMTVLLLSAPVIAAMLGKPEMTNVLRATSALFLLGGLHSLSVMRERKLQRDWHNSLVDLGAYLAHLPLLIMLAWWLRTEWALIIGMIIAEALKLFATYAFYRDPWHRFRLDREVVRNLWQFSRFIVASSLLTIVIVQFDKLFVVGSLSLAVAGLYNMAWSLVLVGENLVQMYGFRVYYPAVADVLRAQGRAPASYYRPMRLVRPLIAFGAAGGVTFGETFFEIAFDPRYAAAGTYFAVLTLRPILRLYTMPGEMVMLALDRPRTKFVADVLRIVWLVPCAIVALQLFGLPGLLWAVVLTELLPGLYFYRLLWREGMLNLQHETSMLLAVAAGLLVGHGAAEAWDLASAAVR